MPADRVFVNVEVFAAMLRELHRRRKHRVVSGRIKRKPRVALRLRELGQGHLQVTNLNDRNQDLLSNLGLDQLFLHGVTSVTEQPEHQPLTASPVDKEAQARTMLEAHEAVIEANPENAAKFKDVLEYLKQDLHLAR